MLLVTGKRDVCCYADAVRLSRLTKLASNAEVQAVIKEWLRTPVIAAAADGSGKQ